MGDFAYTKSPTGDYIYGIVKRLDKYYQVYCPPLYGVSSLNKNSLTQIAFVLL